MTLTIAPEKAGIPRKFSRCIICRAPSALVGQLATSARTHWFGLCSNCSALDAEILAAHVCEPRDDERHDDEH